MCTCISKNIAVYVFKRQNVQELYHIFAKQT